MLNFVRKLFGEKSTPPAAPLPPPPDPEPDEIVVPEISAAELQAELTSESAPFLLDVREPYEWQQVRMPGAVHIPMNDIPQRVDELPHDSPIVVICAHGSRSYGVAGYLLEEGYTARSLAGGLSGWARDGGPVES